ncbi:MAG: hypothetical protein ABI968_08565 [Acidobacteriota bacterium]
MKRPARRKARVRASGRKVAVRVLLWGGLAAALLVLAHAGVTRWLLSGHRLRSWINTSPETTLLEYDEAVSVWPGQLRLKNFRIRGSDSNVEWIVRLAEARADYSIGALLHRTFRVTRLSGSGLSFRLRQKLEPSEARTFPVALLPSIAGFSDPPVRRPVPEDANEAPGPWTVDIRGISLDRFEEIWLDVHHFQGHARLRGRFLLRPGLRARVGPATIDFTDGRLGIGSHAISRSISGKLDAAIEEWDERRVQGSQVWKNLDASLQLRGPLDGLAFLNAYLRDSREPRFSGGHGTLSLGGSIHHGVASGKLELAAREAKARLKDVDLAGNVRTELRIAGWDLERGGFDVNSSWVHVSEVVASGADVSRGWWGRFNLPRGRIQGGLRAHVDSECRDARPLFAIVGLNLPRWTRGLLELEGLTASADVILQPARTRVHELDARGGQFHIQGEYERRGRREDGVFLVDGGPVAVGVRMGESAGLHLIGARKWFEKEKPQVGKAEPARSPAPAKSP